MFEEKFINGHVKDRKNKSRNLFKKKFEKCRSREYNVLVLSLRYECLYYAMNAYEITKHLKNIYIWLKPIMSPVSYFGRMS